MGTGTIFGPGGRIFDTSELTQRPVGLSNRAVAPTYGDRQDLRYADQERSTSNVQRSTFNGVTEKGAWWSEYGDRHGVSQAGERSPWRGLPPRCVGAFAGALERAFSPCCDCWVTKVPTTRTIPAWGNAPRKRSPPHHLTQSKG